jgi:cyclopropane fatty-acyl-phospholipid synthase-like methyltransferase
LIGSVIGNVKEKKILELGFAHGSDLLECERRGAKVFGLDLNQNYISSVKQFTEASLQRFRAGTDTIPFGVQFDLIYSIDTIYYLTDAELE